MKRMIGIGSGLAIVWAVSTGLVVGQDTPKTDQPAPPSISPASGPAAKAAEFPPYLEVIKEHEKVISTMDGKPSMWTLWVRKKDNQILAELPPDYLQKKYFIALTVASGETFAGLQAGELYVYWKRLDKRLLLIEPNVGTRSTGDAPSKSSVKRLFTDRVILDVPILALTPQGGPVFDLDAMLLGQAAKFFGPRVQVQNPVLATIQVQKAFPQNVEVRFEVPMQGGRLKTLHYSISLIPDDTGYKPRLADQRVGYFTTSYNDLGRFKEDDTWVRYVNRWHLEKADPSLKLSKPKNPIIFYIEHTTPVRYIPWVERGVLYWNKAFERVGYRGAIVVQVQNPQTGEHMEKDPEDVRYNFVRWLNNDVGTAIGPSRVHPLTGEILDADIVLTDGWIRHYVRQHKELLPSLAMEGFGPETLAWLDQHPQWDPRIRLATTAERPRMLLERAYRWPQPYGGHPAGNVDATLIGDEEFDGLVGRHSQVNGLCLAAQMKSFDLAVLRMSLEMLEDKEGEKKKEEKKEEERTDRLDGVPEEFIGPLVADLVAHEVGHTLGLRHNFKASGIYPLTEINSDKIKGKAFAGSVMDYLPINIRMEEGALQGDYGMVEIGPYDMWAIEYGYTAEPDLKPILNRVASPELQYATDEDTWGPDPLARRYDFSATPLEYARNQMRLAKYHRERLIEKFVKEGESWAKARRGYEMTLGLQTHSVSMMARWIGGAHVNRDKKGDKDARPPIQVVPAAVQREALEFVVKSAFDSDAFGLTPDLLRHLGIEQWLDAGGARFEDADWPVHDRVMSIQASTLTMLMNPTTLRRVFDNELRTPSDQDMLTLPELLEKVSSAIWSELEKLSAEPATARKPWISSLRRNLQREHLERLIDLTMPDAALTAANKPIANLAVAKLRELKGNVARVLEQKGNLDPYTVAHLSEAQVRIDKALDAQYIYNVRELGGPRLIPFFLFQDEAVPTVRD